MAFISPLKSGKNIKLFYYIRCNWMLAVPRWFYQRRLRRTLEKIHRRPDIDSLMDRVNYYCKLEEHRQLPRDAKCLGEHRPTHPKVYFYDSYEFTRWFPDEYRFSIVPGDVVTVPSVPSLVKTRPLGSDNENSVIMKMDKVRHFCWQRDTLNFADKENRLISRTIVRGKPRRAEFMRKWYGHPKCDLGDFRTRASEYPIEWVRPKLAMRAHLKFRYILALEGVDVATNLKWVMSTNSIAVMPRPTCESWYMEGRLMPNYHYIEIKSDYSDLLERMAYYDEHLDEAEAIIEHAHAWVEQFLDEEREWAISLLVLEKYFAMTK